MSPRASHGSVGHGAAAGRDAGRASGVLAIFQEPSYRRLWASGLCVNVVRWIDLVTLGWLALELTGSPFMVALAAFARSAPMMVVGPFAGIVADRVPRGHVLLVTQAAGAATALVLATLFASGAGGYEPLVALEVVLGLVWALDFPARRMALFSLLGPSRVAQAISLETVSMQVGKMIGPLLAGLCLARLGPASCFALMTALYAIGLVVSIGLHRAIAGPVQTASASVVSSLALGLRAAWASPAVRAVLLCTVAMNVLFFPYQHMLPVFARDVLAAGPAALGALVAADGFGALAGALAIAAQRGHVAHARVFGAGVLAAPVILVAFAASRWLAVCLVLLVVIGAAESAFATMQSTVVLLSAPERVRGGTMGILSACIGTQPLGTLALGLLAGTIGAPSAFTVNAIVALGVIVPLAVPLVRRRP
jgi:MFS family permease